MFTLVLISTYLIVAGAFYGYMVRFAVLHDETESGIPSQETPLKVITNEDQQLKAA